jgi:SulP family sulfate permease
MDGRFQHAWAVRDPRRVRGDVVAGVTVTAYLVPQVMAYAELAGLPAVTALWASIAALGVYALLVGSPQLSVGPESTTALLTGAALGSLASTGSERVALAAALAIVVGAICLVAWLCRLAFLADLLSRPVLIGYMAGIAIIMVVSQLGRLTGAEIDEDGVFSRVWWLLEHPSAVHVPTLVLGLVTLGAMLAGSARWHRAPVALLGMLGATAAVALLDLESRGIEVIGEIPRGLTTPGLPDVSLDQVWPMLVPASALAIVAFSDNIIDARAFASRHGDHIDAHRELFALGAVNVGSGLFHGFPVSSSGSRTAICDAAGGRTRLAGAATMLATLLALLLFRPLLAKFPSAALAAVVVYAAVQLVDLPEFRRIAAFRRSEAAIALAPTASVLALGILEGVLVAVALSVLDVLRRVARPHDAIEGFVPGLAGMHDVDDYPTAQPEPGMVVYRFDSPLFFANAENFGARARAAIAASPTPVRWFVLNTEAIVGVDITAVDALEELRAELADRDIVFALARLKQDLRDELAPSGLIDRIGEELLFPTLPTTVEAYRSWVARHPAADDGPAAG